MDRPDGPEQLHLLVANHLRLEVGRRLHAHDRDELHDVVLHDVAQRAGLLVVRTATFDADLLGNGDLHVVDVLAIPQRLEDAVGKAEDQQVLHGFLAEVMVDAVDLLFDEGRVQSCVELTRRCKVAPERLLDDRPNGGARLLRGETRLVETLRKRQHGVRRRAEVEETVAGGAAFAVRGGERLLEGVESALAVHVELHVFQSRGELVPRLGGQADAPVLLDTVAHVGSKFLGAHVAAAGADDGESIRQRSFGGKGVQRRDQLSLGEVAAGAEDDHAEGDRRARLPAALKQRVLRGQCDDSVPAVAGSAFTGCPPNSLRNAAMTLLPKPSGRRD